MTAAVLHLWRYRLPTWWLGFKYWVEDNWPRVREEMQIISRITWLRLRRKTGQRYVVPWRRGPQPDGSIIQRNGLRLPRPEFQSHYNDVRADMLAAWNALEDKNK